MVCRSSGELTETSGASGNGQIAIASSGRKLISIHGYADSGTVAECIVYDNTAGSGTIVARMRVEDGSFEYDMHGVLCQKGLFAVVTTPTGSGNHGFTVEFS
jgi:hypothetical protein